MLTYAYLSRREEAEGDAAQVVRKVWQLRHVDLQVPVSVGMRQHTSAYVGIRQHTSAYVSI
jgi:hypothetical protein